MFRGLLPRRAAALCLVPALVLAPASFAASSESETPSLAGVVFTPTQGPESGGTRVVFAGTDLDQVTGVSFGGESATDLTVNESGTELSATSPAKGDGPGAVDVILAVGPASTTLATSFLYQATEGLDPDVPGAGEEDDMAPVDVPKATITAMAPASGPTSGGTRVTFTGSNLDQVVAVIFGDLAAADVSVNETGTELLATTPATDAGPVTVTLSLADASTITFGPYEFAAPPEIAPFIINGVPAVAGDAPWQVALLSPGDNLFNAQFCGGSILNATWIITAAHCLQGTNSNPANVRVLAGQQDLLGGGGQLSRPRKL